MGERTSRALTAVALAMILAACGGAPESASPALESPTGATPTVEPPDGAESPQATPTATPEPEPSEPTATLRQVASVVAEHEPQIRELVERIGDCWGGYFLCEGPAFEILPHTLFLTISTFALRLDDVEPPAEVADLTLRTVGGAEALAAALRAFLDESCTAGAGRSAAEWEGDCRSLSADVYFAIRGLDQAFNAWRPYL